LPFTVWFPGRCSKIENEDEDDDEDDFWGEGGRAEEYARSEMTILQNSERSMEKQR
jgi:hypothetical protein